MDKLFGWIKKDILRKEKSGEDSYDKSTDKDNTHGEGSTTGDKDKEKETEEEPREKKIIIVTTIDVCICLFFILFSLHATLIHFH